MWADLFRALALVCVIEGLMPFMAPERWRETMLRLTDFAPRQLRIFGGALIVGGILLLQLLHYF